MLLNGVGVTRMQIFSSFKKYVTKKEKHSAFHWHMNYVLIPTECFMRQKCGAAGFFSALTSNVFKWYAWWVKRAIKNLPGKIESMFHNNCFIHWNLPLTIINLKISLTTNRVSMNKNVQTDFCFSWQSIFFFIKV